MNRGLTSAARRHAAGIAIALACVSCRGGGSGNSGNSEETGSTSAAETAAATTFAAPDACMSSDDCETSGSCIAPYDPAPGDDAAGRGPAACVDACIGADDIQRWCIDDASCCDDLHCNAVDGFCERSPAIGSSSSDEGGSTFATEGSGSTTSDTSTGQASTGSSSDTGSSSSETGGSSSSSG